MKSLAILLLFAFLPLILSGQEQIRLNLEPGMEYTTETHTNTEMIQKVMGIDQEIIIDMELVSHSKVVDFSDSVYSIEYTYKSLKMETSSSLYSSVVDTDAGENTESQLMRVITGKPFILKITSGGIIREVNGIEKIFDSLEDEIDLDSVAMSEFRTSLEGSFGKEAFIQNMQTFFVRYPEKPVQEGDVWTYSYHSSAADQRINIFTVVNLQDINRNEIIVRLNGKISTPEGNEYMDIDGMPGRVNFNGESISEIVVDKKTGLPRETSLSQKLKGSLSFKPDRNSDDVMTIPTTIILKSSSYRISE